MNKVRELKGTTKIVKEILEQYPETRDSDDTLYLKVCGRINYNYISIPVALALSNRKDYGIPCWETVSRARRRLQRAYPELAAKPDVEAGRMLNEEIFKDYSKGAV